MKANDSLDIRRFGRYFCHEIRETVSGQGLFLLLAGLAPVIVAAVYSILSISVVSTQKDMYWGSYQYVTAIIALLVQVIFFLVFPILKYGHLNDSRSGQTDILLPVSVSEKFTAAMLTVLLIVPTVFFTLYIGSDFIISEISPRLREQSCLIEQIAQAKAVECTESVVTVSCTYTFFMPWMISLAGLSGALAFKKNKISKTFYVCAAAFILFWAFLINIAEYAADFKSEYIGMSWAAAQTAVTIGCGIYAWYKFNNIKL